MSDKNNKSSEIEDKDVLNDDALSDQDIDDLFADDEDELESNSDMGEDDDLFDETDNSEDGSDDLDDILNSDDADDLFGEDDDEKSKDNLEDDSGDDLEDLFANEDVSEEDGDDLDDMLNSDDDDDLFGEDDDEKSKDDEDSDDLDDLLDDFEGDEDEKEKSSDTIDENNPSVNITEDYSKKEENMKKEEDSFFDDDDDLFDDFDDSDDDKDVDLTDLDDSSDLDDGVFDAVESDDDESEEEDMFFTNEIDDSDSEAEKSEPTIDDDDLKSIMEAKKGKGSFFSNLLKRGKDKKADEEVPKKTKEKTFLDLEEEKAQEFNAKMKKASSSNSIGIILGSVVVTSSLFIAGGYFSKDYISDLLFAEKQVEIAGMERSLNNRIDQLNKTIADSNERAERVYATNDQLELTFTNLNGDNVRSIENLKGDLDSNIKYLNQLQNDLEMNMNRVAGLEDGEVAHNEMIRELRREIEDQKELMRRTVQITLDVIHQNREIEERINSSVYSRVIAQTREDMRRQRQELYDFSIIEDNLTQSANQIAEMTREIASQRAENQKLRSEITSLRTRLDDIEGISSELRDSLNNQANQAPRGNRVIEELTRNDDNTISIQRSQAEAERSRGGSNESAQPSPTPAQDSPLPALTVIAVLADRFYVRDDNSSDPFTMYRVGDNLPSYGKILRIENQQIYAERGIVRKK